MNICEKFEYIRAYLNVDKNTFCEEFELPLTIFEDDSIHAIDNNCLTEYELSKLLNFFQFEYLDFITCETQIIKSSELQSHHVIVSKNNLEDKDTLYEDYVRQDDSRYEEND